MLKHVCCSCAHNVFFVETGRPQAEQSSSAGVVEGVREESTGLFVLLLYHVLGLPLIQ